MKFVDEFRSAETAARVAREIASLVEPGNTVRVMEVCGGHTHTIYRHGLEDLVPDEIEFLHGPGCPVCVIPMGRVDDAISLAERPGTIFTTFGDMLRVPGGRGSLLEAKARGADVRMVYSPLDALEIAKQTPERDVVFFAVGFETTAPATAVTMLRARAERVRNFSAFVNHVTIVPPLRAILDSPGLATRRVHRPRSRLDGDRHAPVRVHPGGARKARRSGSVRADRRAARGRPDPPPAPRRPLRGGEPVHARRHAATATPARRPR